MIDPRRLQVLLAFAYHGTVTAAARALHLSPSAVSQQLANLEQEAGHPLFERDGRGIRLSPSGRVLVVHARRVASVMEAAEADLAAASSGLRGTVKLAAFSSAISEVVSPAITSLRESVPELTVHVSDAEGPAARRLLLEGEVDCAVMVAQADVARSGTDELEHLPLYVEPFLAIIPTGWTESDMNPVRLGELERRPWVTPWPGNPIRELTLTACAEAGFRPDISSVSDDFRAIFALVQAEVGVAIAPRSTLRGLDTPQVAVREIQGSAPVRRVHLVLRAGTRRHPLVKCVADALSRCSPSTTGGGLTDLPGAPSGPSSRAVARASTRMSSA